MERYYQDIFNQISNHILIKNRFGVFTFANKSMAKYYNTTVDNMVGKTDSDFESDGLILNQYAAADTFVLENGKEQRSENSYHFNEVTGEERWFTYTKSRIRNLKGEYEVLTIIVDVTDSFINEKRLKRHKELIQARNKMLEKTTSELDKFVYSASHDFRGPLLSISGLINLVKQENPSSLVSQYLSMMQKSIEKLNQFIKDIMNYAINSKIRIEIEEFNIEELVTDCFNNVSINFETSNIKLKIYNNGGTLKTDKKRVAIIINNLISNAIKYQDDSKEDHLIDVYIQHTYLKYIIIVEDNGVGIEQEFLSQVSEMFFRANEKSDGAGIGLYIVKDTLEKLQGTLKIESILDESTKVTIKIPTVVRDFTNTEILLVEDDEDHAELMMRALQKLNCYGNTLWLKDGKLALDFLLKEGEHSNLPPGLALPKLILLDIKLPKVDGIGVLNEIRHYPELADIEVVIITSSTNGQEKERCIKMGAKAVLHKPPKTNELKPFITKLDLQDRLN